MIEIIIYTWHSWRFKILDKQDPLVQERERKKTFILVCRSDIDYFLSSIIE